MRQVTFADLVDLVENRLPEGEAAALASNGALDGERVQATLAWLRAFHAVSDAVVLAEPPAWVRESLRKRFRQVQSSAARREPVPTP